MHVRLAQPADAEAIRSIYNDAVASGTSTFDLVPRTPAEQHVWMTDHAGGHPAVVAVDEDGVVRGFGSLSPYRERAAYRTTVENSVYVDASYRGQGMGRAILGELVVLATGHGFHTVIARVGESNEASIGLHRACGFEPVGVERQIGRKFGRWLDVTVLQRML
jgi:phosphinothricin acetyltransferase